MLSLHVASLLVEKAFTGNIIIMPWLRGNNYEIYDDLRC